MSDEILVTIAGAQGTEFGSLSNAILHSVPYEVEIIELDKLLLEPQCKQYSYRDYDFGQVRKLIRAKFDAMQNSIKIIILCGSYALYDKELNRLSNLKIYIECDSDKRLINLIKQEGQSDVLTCSKLSNILKEYMDNIREETNKYVLPTRQFANIIIPQNNDILGQMIVVDGIKHLITEREQRVICTTDDGRRISTTTTTTATEGKIYWNYEKELLDLEKNRYLDLS